MKSLALIMLIMAPAWLTIGAEAYARPLWETTSGDAHRRPATVPAKALWIGGMDGGIYVLIARDKLRPGRFRASVWNDFSGALIFRGWMKPVGVPAASVRIDDFREFSGWDGEALYRREGGRLQAVR